jgi:hypothetical protein
LPMSWMILTIEVIVAHYKKAAFRTLTAIHSL